MENLNLNRRRNWKIRKISCVEGNWVFEKINIFYYEKFVGGEKEEKEEMQKLILFQTIAGWYGEFVFEV